MLDSFMLRNCSTLEPKTTLMKNPDHYKPSINMESTLTYWGFKLSWFLMCCKDSRQFTSIKTSITEIFIINPKFLQKWIPALKKKGETDIDQLCKTICKSSASEWCIENAKFLFDWSSKCSNLYCIDRNCIFGIQ